MYPPNQPKVPPVRPRSSLSTDEHHRFKDSKSRRKNASNTVVTLVGFCVFLFVLCVFLLGALVYVGRTIADGVAASNVTEITTSRIDNLMPYPPPHQENSHPNVKPIVIFRPNQMQLPETTSQQEISSLGTTTTITTTTTAKQTTTTTKTTAKTTKLPPNVMANSRILNLLSFRLPREIRPKQYNLWMHPKIEEKTFRGNVTIRFEVLKPIPYIALHLRSLNITTDAVYRTAPDTGDKLKDMNPMITFEHHDFEYWITEFKDNLETGEYAIQLSFNGSLANSIEGFYESLYLDQLTNETRSIATTKFEPTYARQAFPCFDEPAMKATFLITIVRPNKGGYHALSNMNVESEKIVGENTEVTFAETVPMSTYLACFIVSDFAHKTMMVKGGADSKDFEMRAFATEAQLHKVTYALTCGVGITEYYIEYFGIAYPLPKLDMTAIPDFSAGAMENWGLVTYRETALLYDKAISSTVNKRRVAMVVAHELAHMWFGNLVTMKWWNDLWLNEGFASYIEYKGINHIHPEWKMLDQFLTLDLHSAMRIDSTLASHPIVQIAETPYQISELFDSITYKKGASVIRMLEDVSGPEKFKMATHNYLNKYKFSNAETDDFLSEVEAIGFDFDVKYMMKTWTEQMGLPVVEVTKLSNNQYKLTQKRFLLNPDDYNVTHIDSPFNYRWLIPITYFTSHDQTVQRSWFNDNDAEHTITLPSEDVKWLKINKNQMGYYLVNYPPETWKAITNALITDLNAFSISDRAHLISDAFNLADASQLSYSIALNLTRYLENETDYVPWSVASSALKSVRNLLNGTDLYDDFLKYNNKILDKATSAIVKWEIGDNDLQKLASNIVLNTACAFENQNALEQVKEKFKTWIDQPDIRPNPDVRQVIYYYGMKYAGTKDIWEKMWQLFVTETDASEKLKLMDGLAAIQDENVLQKFVDLAWDETYVRRQDYFSCLHYISYNPIGEKLIWNYVRENWEKMIDRFGIGDQHLGGLIPGITSRFATNEKLDELLAFFQKYPDSGAGEISRKHAIEKVKYNIKWLTTNKEQIGSWLKSQ